MYNKIQANKSCMKINTSYVGETIEKKVFRILNNKEPITDGAPVIYTERKDGVQPAYDPRTDRWEVALEAMDSISRGQIAKRQERMSLGEEAKKNMEKEQEIGKTKPIQDTDSETAK